MFYFLGLGWFFFENVFIRHTQKISFVFVFKAFFNQYIKSLAQRSRNLDTLVRIENHPFRKKGRLCRNFSFIWFH